MFRRVAPTMAPPTLTPFHRRASYSGIPGGGSSAASGPGMAPRPQGFAPDPLAAAQAIRQAYLKYLDRIGNAAAVSSDEAKRGLADLYGNTNALEDARGLGDPGGPFDALNSSTDFTSGLGEPDSSYLSQLSMQGPGTGAETLLGLDTSIPADPVVGAEITPFMDLSGSGADALMGGAASGVEAAGTVSSAAAPIAPATDMALSAASALPYAGLAMGAFNLGMGLARGDDPLMTIVKSIPIVGSLASLGEFFANIG